MSEVEFLEIEELPDPDRFFELGEWLLEAKGEEYFITDPGGNRRPVNRRALLAAMQVLFEKEL